MSVLSKTPSPFPPADVTHDLTGFVSVVLPAARLRI